MIAQQTKDKETKIARRGFLDATGRTGIRSYRLRMLRYFFQRFLMTLPALWLVLTLVFLMIHIVPGDPVEQMLGEGARAG